MYTQIGILCPCSKQLFDDFRFFSVFSADTEKVAELQVAIVLESLMGKKQLLRLNASVAMGPGQYFSYEVP